ncbi:DUF998 domain-containing protein [Microbacterium sp. E-13]|uniref:DUF998 domain-containing protein n=1 Tax=Microbacterium sp. E-13 TaxID=3404048 RepID=UPI003CEF6327
MSVTQEDRAVVTTWARRGLVVGVAVAPVFIVTDLVDGLVRPGYSVLRHWVSHRALGEYGWIGIVTIAVSALMLLACAIALFAVRRRANAKTAYPLTVCIAAIGLLTAALFPMDPSLGFPPGTELTPTTQSVSGAIHNVAGPVFILGMAVAAFLSGRYVRRVSHGAVAVGLGWVAGVAIVISFVLTSVLVSLDFAGVLPGAWSGLFERIAIYIGLIWSALICSRLLAWTAVR